MRCSPRRTWETGGGALLCSGTMCHRDLPSTRKVPAVLKDRFLGLLTTTALLALPGLALAADRSDWATDQIRRQPELTWLLALLLIFVLIVLLGIEKRGYWDGVLIDHTNRKSLSRLQAVVWGALIVSGVAAGIAVNVARGCGLPGKGSLAQPDACSFAPWDLGYPDQFLILASLSAVVLFLATLINGVNARRTLSSAANQSAQSAGILVQLAADADADPNFHATSPNRFFGVIVGKDDVDRSSWSDIAKGDVASHAAYLDLGRVQFLIVTMLVAGLYAVFYLRELDTESGAVSFPAFDAGISLLLGISAATYLGIKLINGIVAAQRSDLE
ncbi:hypothetical protein BH23CHL5_BH23CHL5_19020 [soil metagenome]